MAFQILPTQGTRNHNLCIVRDRLESETSFYSVDKVARGRTKHGKSKKEERTIPFGLVAHGGLLRHRPKRGERCPNYDKLYQCQRSLPKIEGVPKA
ncbi:MAG: hypothetical protein Aurels2KO_10710 [Aureliella sp.]